MTVTAGPPVIMLPPPPRQDQDKPPPPLIFTDNDGRFDVTSLEPGRYTLAVRKAGYVATTYGARHAGEPPIAIDLEDGGRATIAMRLPRSAGISGRILDQYGEPIEGVLVTAERLIRSEGRMTTRAAGSATTDDLGEFRVGGLSASRYVIGASVNRPGEGGIFFDFGPGVDPDAMQEAIMRVGVSQLRTYYPGVLGLSSAQPIEVRTAEERTSADFVIPPDTSFPALTLNFVDADGKSVPADVMLANAASAVPRFVPVPARNARITTRIDPGQWTVLARANNGTVGAVDVNVTGDTAATVVLQRGGRISGRVETDGAPLPAIRFAMTAAHPAEIGVGSRWGGVAPTRPDGAFELRDLAGPLVLRVVNVPRGWSVKSITYAGRDISETPIDFKPATAINDVHVVMTSRVAMIEGAAIDAQGSPLVDYSVLVFPEDRTRAAHARRFARWARPTSGGRFSIDDVLPGDYLAVAVTDVDDTQWQNADYLERFRAQATRVTLRESEKKTVMLTLVTP